MYFSKNLTRVHSYGVLKIIYPHRSTMRTRLRRAHFQIRRSFNSTINEIKSKVDIYTILGLKVFGRDYFKSKGRSKHFCVIRESVSSVIQTNVALCELPEIPKPYSPHYS